MMWTKLLALTGAGSYVSAVDNTWLALRRQGAIQGGDTTVKRQNKALRLADDHDSDSLGNKVYSWLVPASEDAHE